MKREETEDLYMGDGVMKDQKVTLRDLHTLGVVYYILIKRQLKRRPI
jgi:hypothetical protein